MRRSPLFLLQKTHFLLLPYLFITKKPLFTTIFTPLTMLFAPYAKNTCTAQLMILTIQVLI
jgi:hypothetical protein